MDDAFPIAAVVSDPSHSAGAVLTDVAKRLQSEGCRLAGAVQVDDGLVDHSNCRMTLSVLPDGPEIGISQILGKEAKGCRLDHEALEDVVSLVESSMDETTQVLIINKFGKRESEGAGFRQTIARAIALNIPVLVGIGETERPAFESFVGDGDHVLPPCVDDILLWCNNRSI